MAKGQQYVVASLFRFDDGKTGSDRGYARSEEKRDGEGSSRSSTEDT